MIEEFLKKANILFENKEYEEVVKLIKNYPKNNHPSILYYSALINDKLKKKEKALKILNQLIENHPNFLEPFHLSANINEDLKKYDESEKILKEIIKKNSNDWKAIYNLARIKLKSSISYYRKIKISSYLFFTTTHYISISLLLSTSRIDH